jgi:hypothetical protein
LRYYLLFEISQSIRTYEATRVEENAGPPINIYIPKLTPSQQAAADRSAEIEDLRRALPQALNLPVLLLEMPYTIANPAKMEWVPQGMMLDDWRSITWPFAGILFWWSAGRGIEALRLSRKGLIAPRVTLVETVLAALFVCTGFATVVGAITSTPDDRSDIKFIALLAGGMLWGVLAGTMIIARIFQWRIRRGTKSLASLA